MSSPDQGGVTELLLAWKAGDAKAMNQLMPLVYDELRRMAASLLARERAQTLQPTAMVHQAYLRLVDYRRIDWQGRAHFFAMAALQMRRLLVDHARSRRRQKRGGGLTRIELPESDRQAAAPDVDLLALDEALERLTQLDARQARGRAALLRRPVDRRVRQRPRDLCRHGQA